MKINQKNNPITENQPKYLNLLTDFGFKKMFGEENKKFLIALINSILSKSVGDIEDATYMNTEQLGKNPKEKKMVYDIYCTTSNKQHIIGFKFQISSFKWMLKSQWLIAKKSTVNVNS